MCEVGKGKGNERRRRIQEIQDTKQNKKGTEKRGMKYEESAQFKIEHTTIKLIVPQLSLS
jgi:hypothetical protein